MTSIADAWRAKHTPRVYTETINGKPLRVECPDFVLHRVMIHQRCSTCKDRDWVFTPEGHAAYLAYLEQKAAQAVFEQLEQE